MPCLEVPMPAEPEKTRFSWGYHLALFGFLGLGIHFGIQALSRSLKRWDETVAFFSSLALLVPVLSGLALLGCAGLILLALWRGRQGKPLHPRGSDVRLAVYAVVAGLAIQLAALQPFDKTRFYLAGALGFLSFVVGWLLWERLPGRVRKLIDVLLANVCFLLLGLELALRLSAMFSSSPLLRQPGSDLLAMYRNPPGMVRFGFPTNAQGHYDEAFRPRQPGETLVACIGDSFSPGSVPHAYHFTTVCEQTTGWTVANLGFPAIGPPEYLRLLRDEALPLQPSLMVVQLFCGNDLVGYRGLDWRRSWGDRENLLVYLLPRRILTVSGGRTRSGEPQGIELSIGGSLEQTLPWLLDPRLEEGTFDLQQFNNICSSRVLDNCAPEQTSFEPLFEVLADIIEAAGDVPLCFVLLPDEPQVEDALWETIVAAHPEAVLQRDLPQARIGAWLSEHGIPHLDLLPVFRAEPPLEDGERHLFHLRDTHFNARGNRVSGQAMARFFAELLR